MFYSTSRSSFSWNERRGPRHCRRVGEGFAEPASVVDGTKNTGVAQSFHPPCKKSPKSPLRPFLFIVVDIDIGFGMKLAGAEFLGLLIVFFVFLGA
jgi:hypothetical protein